LHRAVRILLSFQRDTGHEHPQLRILLGNYLGVLRMPIRSDLELRAILTTLLEEFGVTL
jgi:hypothetical protein